jgi:hypothetical protein
MWLQEWVRDNIVTIVGVVSILLVLISAFGPEVDKLIERGVHDDIQRLVRFCAFVNAIPSRIGKSLFPKLKTAMALGGFIVVLGTLLAFFSIRIAAKEPLLPDDVPATCSHRAADH